MSEKCIQTSDKQSDDSFSIDENPPIVIFTKSVTSYKHSIFFNEFPSDKSKQVAQMCEVISNAADIDEINIFMNNNGGSCSVGFQLLHHIDLSQCSNIKISADSELYSMAPVFLVGAARSEERRVGKEG